MALDAYKKESDTVALFNDEFNYKKSLTDRITTRTLYVKYQDFYKDSGFRSLNIRNFSTRLQYLGFEHIKSNGFNGFYMTLS